MKGIQPKLTTAQLPIFTKYNNGTRLQDVATYGEKFPGENTYLRTRAYILKQINKQ